MLAEVFERADALSEVYAPYILTAIPTRHIGGEIEVLSIGGDGGVSESRECVGSDFKLLGCAPGGIRAFGGIDFDRSVSIQGSASACQVHGLAIGREGHHPLVEVAVQFPFGRLWSLPVALFILGGVKDIATFHAGNFRLIIAGSLLIRRTEIDGIKRFI